MESRKLFYAQNLKLLRNRKKISQDDLAERLGITRVKLNSHENGTSKNPPLEDLVNIARYFRLALDTLVTIDLSKLSELKLRELEGGNDIYLSGGKIRILSITVDKDNRENAEFVPLKAKAGYVANYSDPEFISELPKFTLPHLSEKKTYRMFPTEGDSMHPIPANCVVITEFVDDWKMLKDCFAIVAMRNVQDLLFKVVSYLPDPRSLLLHSLNPDYKDQIILAEDIHEVWKYNSHITDILPSSDTILSQILKVVNEIKVGSNVTA